MNNFLKILLILLIAVNAHAATVYINPDCGNPGDGSTGVCDGTASDNPLAAWPSMSSNNDYYQLVGTTYSCSISSGSGAFSDSSNNISRSSPIPKPTPAISGPPNSDTKPL